MGHKIVILLCLIGALTLCAEQPYKLVIHNTDPQAKCLDGSSPALYLHEGGDTQHFLVYFVGGNYCSGLTFDAVLEDCYKRSKTDLGSSRFLKEEVLSPGGYLSTDPAKSRFANWTKVVIMYCDGGQHQGHNNDPISYRDAQLYMRGSDNTRSHFKWLLNTYRINQAEKVLLSGASAGGIATFTWSNYLRRLMDNPEHLYTVADSSIFANVSYPYTDNYLFDILGTNLWKITLTRSSRLGSAT
jgi:O-palmitoleoyl-L-serine hydrolase